MPSKERRQKEKDAVRGKILDAARELFIERGFEAVSMRQIARKIDYTAAALYTHFEDKDALFREICDADFSALQQSFAKLAKVRDPIERLRELGRIYVEFAMTHPSSYRLMFLTTKPEKAVLNSQIDRGNPDQDAYAFLRATVAEALAAGRFRPDLHDADLIAQVVWSAAHGLVALHMTHKHDPWFDWRPIELAAWVSSAALLRGLVAD